MKEVYRHLWTSNSTVPLLKIEINRDNSGKSGRVAGEGCLRVSEQSEGSFFTSTYFPKIAWICNIDSRLNSKASSVLFITSETAGKYSMILVFVFQGGSFYK